MLYLSRVAAWRGRLRLELQSSHCCRHPPDAFPLMDVDASTFMPRLRMSKHSPVQYDRSSNIASVSEAGPSRLPNFSQILDLDMKDMPLSDDQFFSSELDTPKITTAPAATRSDNPAAVLRALLSRLPAHPPSPTQSHALSVQDVTERESDFDTVSESNPAPSIAQESLKHIFSNAFCDPDNMPRKMRDRHNSIDISEVEATPRIERERATNKGKRRSMSDDKLEDTSRELFWGYAFSYVNKVGCRIHQPS